MVTYDNEFETKENKITSKDKTEPQHIQFIQKEKHFYGVHWSGPEDDSIFVRTHSYNKLKKIIFISWNDKFYCTLMIMIWTQKILHNYETILAHFCFDWKQKWNNQCQFLSLFLILRPYFHLPLKSELSDNYYKIIR